VRYNYLDIIRRTNLGLSYFMNYLPPPNQHEYYNQVWALVQQIPSGRVATYGQITKLLPQPENISEEDYQLSASRWVGLAMGACPDDVPWQRVINSQGKISHKTEAAKQKSLLKEEGVFFSNDKLNLTQYQWSGPGQSDGPRQESLF